MEEMIFPAFETGKRELRYSLVSCVLGTALTDFVLYGGFNLGFALASVLIVAATWIYLTRSGKKSAYGTALLLMAAIIGASFVRSNDGFVKFVMFCFLFGAENLGYAVLSGKNLYAVGAFSTLADALTAFFAHGVGGMSPVFRGLRAALKNSSERSKNRSAVLIGLLISLPLVLVLGALLVSADAAFEGMMALLPRIRLEEPVTVLMMAVFVVPVTYARAVSLARGPETKWEKKEKKLVNSMTINTILIMVCLIFSVYLVSQLAYFTGGLSGILPQGFTMAQYARRGFFEMAVLCGMDLGIIGTAVGLTRPREGKAPALTRWLCLMVGLVTVFFVVSASAKMALYIASYGLTRLRVLTEVITLFFGIATVLVCVWVFHPRFGYMKAVVLTALVMGAAVAWTDVDTVVAAYNVRAYQSGVLQSVDVNYLAELSNGANPYLEELTHCSDETVAKWAKQELEARADYSGDFRGWYITAKK